MLRRLDRCYHKVPTSDQDFNDMETPQPAPSATDINGYTDAPIPSFTPTQLSFPLPRAIGNTQIYLHLSCLAKAILLFLTTAPAGSGSESVSLASLGSFVHAIPDVRIPFLSLGSLFSIVSK